MVGAKFLISQTNQVAGKEQPIKMHNAVPQVTAHKSEPVEYYILMHCWSLVLCASTAPSIA